MHVCVCVCVYHIIFIYFLVDGHSGGFHILVIVNNAAMNIGTHVSFQMSVFWVYIYIYTHTHTHTHTPRSRIVGSYGGRNISLLG